jgi:hypothetical protein
MSRSFKECVELALAIELLLVVLGETLPGAEHVLPVGGSHLKQFGALVGLAIALYAIRHFFGTASKMPARRLPPALDGDGRTRADGIAAASPRLRALEARSSAPDATTGCRPVDAPDTKRASHVSEAMASLERLQHPARDDTSETPEETVG